MSRWDAVDEVGALRAKVQELEAERDRLEDEYRNLLDLYLELGQ